MTHIFDSVTLSQAERQKETSMAILKPGDPKRAMMARLQIKHFACDTCGCEFQCGNDLYVTDFDKREARDIITATCPCCEETVYWTPDFGWDR